jgi:hypothetical protein
VLEQATAMEGLKLATLILLLKELEISSDALATSHHDSQKELPQMRFAKISIYKVNTSEVAFFLITWTGCTI